MKRLKVLISAGLLLGAFASQVFAQDFPQKQIKFVVPFPPGVTDMIARTVASVMERDFNQSIVVENKVGASGMIGVEAVRNAAPDGYTVLVASNQQFTALPQMRDAPYKLEDFIVLGTASSSPVAFVGRKDLPFDDIKGLVSYAQENPRKLRVATSGPQSAGDISVKMLSKLANIELSAIPYTGVSPSIVAQLGGEVDITIIAPNGARQHVEAGNLKWIGVESPERVSHLPDLPTLLELGYDIRDDVKSVFLVSAKTPAPVVEALTAALARAVESPELEKVLEQAMISKLNLSGEDARKVLQDDYDYWTASLGMIDLLK